MKKKTRNAADLLVAAASTYRQRNKVYGNSYHDHGKVMTALFPNGVTLKSVSDFNRFVIIDQIVVKMIRYNHNFGLGGHKDSIHDIAVYASMLEELDCLL